MDWTNYMRPTLDDLLTNNQISDPQRPFFEAVADCTRAGVRIGKLPFETRSKSMHETRATQKHSELLLAAHALVAVGLRRCDLVPGERPDFTLRYGAEAIGPEVAELVEPASARVANATENIRIGIRELVDTDATLTAALGDRFISLRPWVCPKRSLERPMVEEYGRLIRAIALPKMLGSQVNDPAYPAMRACKVHVYVSSFSGGYVDFTTPPTAFDPQGLVPVATRVLERKRKKAAAYSGGPHWLVMAVTDGMGTFDPSVDALGSFFPDIAPFEVVIIRGSSRVAVWTAGKHMSVAI